MAATDAPPPGEPDAAGGAPKPAVVVLREAAAKLRDVAPDITGPLAGLADPVADWLEHEARQEAYTLAEFGHRSASRPALAVARAVLGEA